MTIENYNSALLFMHELKQQEDALTLRYKGEMEKIKQELDNEKKRPLSLKERLTGRKGV